MIKTSEEYHMKKRTACLLAAFLLISILVPAYSAAAADQTTVQQAIRALGVIVGDESGNLNLSGTTTRAQFAKMMIAASTNQDTVSQTASVSPFKDVRSTDWAAGYIQAAVAAGWLTGYVDGTYRPSNSITLEEAATAVLKMLGYTTSDFSGSFPEAQLAKCKGLGLDENISKTRGQALSRQDCMYLFYNLMGVANKEGKTYAETLGYSLNAAGELDYSSLVSANLKGPYVVKNTSSWTSVLPFSASAATVYRNGAASGLSAVSLYDVFYYNANLRTIWFYRNTVTGIYKAAAPNAVAPTSVTVAGQTYSITTSDAAYDLSELGAYGVGDTVTLLLGMKGDVVGVMPAAEVNEMKYGMVTETGKETLTDSLGASYEASVVKVFCTDGNTYEYVWDNAYLDVGDLVGVSFSGGGTAVTKLQQKTTAGAVNAAGTALGALRLADDVEILDTTEHGSCAAVYPARLAGMTLSAGEVRYYVLNESGEVSRLILNNATGDLNSYGILTSVKANLSEMNSSAVYTYIIGGTASTFNSNMVYSVKAGPASFEVQDGALKSIKNLSGVQLTSVNSVSAWSGGKAYRMAESVSVYLYDKSGDVYYLTNLSAVSDAGRYTLTGYYDKNYSAGGRIRLIIAVAK